MTIASRRLIRLLRGDSVWAVESGHRKTQRVDSVKTGLGLFAQVTPTDTSQLLINDRINR